jgi:hypothetical protein
MHCWDLNRIRSDHAAVTAAAVVGDAGAGSKGSKYEKGVLYVDEVEFWGLRV